MYLKNINIIDFKNIRSCDLEFGERINCFVGDNGAGKTNFLDAIYYLSLCKSITGTSDRQNINHEGNFFMIDGNYYTPDSHNNFVCSYTPSSIKTIKRNGKSYTKISEHIGAVPLVAVTPSDNSLIDESGEARRRYLNTFISQLNSSYLTSLIKYNSIIAQRNLVLKENIDNDHRDILEIYDSQLSELAQRIYDIRKEIIAELSPIVSAYYNVLSGGAEEVELSYSSSLDKSTMQELLQQSFPRDCACGYTTVGIGRDDLKMKINHFPIKRFGSQGQQKSFLISMKLAQYDIIAARKSIKPLLLLDDIFDRLDSSRVSALLQVVNDEKFGQIFITDCDGDRVKRILESQDSDYKVFNISKGGVE